MNETGCARKLLYSLNKIQFLSLTHIADRYEGTGVVTNSVECPSLTKEKDFSGGEEGREI